MKKIFLLIALIISFNTATIKTAPDRTHVFTAVVIASATYYFHQEINNFIKNTRKNICACRNEITKSFNKFCRDIKKEFNKIKLPSFTFPWTIIIDVNSNQQTIVEAGEEVTKEFPLTNLNGINAWGPGNVVIECNPNLKEEKLTIITDKNVFDVLEHYPKFKTFNFGPESNIHFKKTPTINYIVYVKHLNKLNISGSLDVSTNTIIAPSEDITIDLSGSGNLECNITANNFVLNDSGSGNITLNGSAKKTNNKAFRVCLYQCK